jgi:hypothetical protein
MAYISRALRQLVTERAGGLCEYCHTAQVIVIEMEIDHIVPEVVGGVTEAGNLCLACISCNTLKRDYQTGSIRRPRLKCLYFTHVSSHGASISNGMQREHTSSARRQLAEPP